MLILPVLLYGTEAWILLSADLAALRNEIFSPLRVGDDFCIRSNSELYELLNDIDDVQRSNTQRVRWGEDAAARRVFDVGICESLGRGRHYRHRWKDQIEDQIEDCHRLV